MISSAASARQPRRNFKNIGKRSSPVGGHAVLPSSPASPPAIARSGSAVMTARASSTRTVPVGVAATPSRSCATCGARFAGGGSSAAVPTRSCAGRAADRRRCPRCRPRARRRRSGCRRRSRSRGSPSSTAEIDRGHDVAAQAEHAGEARRRQEHARDRLDRQRLAHVGDRQRELLPAQLEADEAERPVRATQVTPSARGYPMLTRRRHRPRSPDVEVFLRVLRRRCRRGTASSV